jgi:hypothetical protein
VLSVMYELNFYILFLRYDGVYEDDCVLGLYTVRLLRNGAELLPK